MRLRTGSRSVSGGRMKPPRYAASATLATPAARPVSAGPVLTTFPPAPTLVRADSSALGACIRPLPATSAWQPLLHAKPLSRRQASYAQEQQLDAVSSHRRPETRWKLSPAPAQPPGHLSRREE